MKLQQLKPVAVWHYFEEITRIPRPSGHEEKIQRYLLDFAHTQGLKSHIDQTGNIIIYKEASPDYSTRATVILQAHIDMVCEKNQETHHDFNNDPINIYLEGEWVKAHGTTLGADNGIGMAMILAALADKNLAHGKIEAVFTVEEETGLTGALNIAPDLLSGSLLINLDSEDEDQVFIGCAGGIDTRGIFTYTPTPIKQESFFVEITISGLQGGHSGCDIHAGLGNANKILNRFLWQYMQKYPMELCSFNGGNLHNAIPREATAIVAIPSNDKEDIRVAFNLFAAAIEGDIHAIEPNLTCSLRSTTPVATAIDHATAQRIINTLYALPHGVIAMSLDMQQLVATSTNLAAVKTEEHTLTIITSQRSESEVGKNDIAQQVVSVFALANAEIRQSDGYPGWKPNLQSPLLATALSTYKQLYHITPEIRAIHAGLECGLFLKKYPHLDMISFGPTIKGVHSPHERLHIASVEKCWNHLKKILKEI